MGAATHPRSGRANKFAQSKNKGPGGNGSDSSAKMKVIKGIISVAKIHGELVQSWKMVLKPGEAFIFHFEFSS